MSQNLAAGIPIFGGLFDDSQDQALAQAKKNQDLYNSIALPDLKNYTPEDYSYVGDLSPALAQATQVQDNSLARSAQMSALEKMAGLADTGLSAVDQAGYEKARSIGDQLEHSGNAAAMQNAQARGVGGSGLEFLMREQADQDGAQRAQEAGLQQAADSARQKVLYNQAYLQGETGLRNQDFSNNQANANILNSFNMANTNTQNQAQQYNLGNRQNVSNLNTQGHNQAQQYNNSLAQEGFQDQMQRAGGISGANQGMYNGYAAENAANTAFRNQNTQLAAQGVMMGMGGGSAPTTKTKTTGDQDNYFSNLA